MPRPYHSPSSIELGKRCQHAWALRYIAGIREPEVTWAQIEAAGDDWQKKYKPRQRSTALGKAVHAVGEAWQTPGAPPIDWHSLPGEVFLSGADLIPHPTRVHYVHTEAPIGRVPLPPARKLTEACAACGVARGVLCRAGCWTRDAPTHALEVGGLLWAGYRDLLVSAPGEFIRLKIAAPDGWALYDYKSTASIDRYALDPAGLLVDPQANLYAIDVCEMLGVFEIPARWVYFETKKVRRAKAVDVTIHYEQALSIMAPCVSLARELDTITRIEDAPKNPFACGDYGGCEFHKSAGGPCDAKRSTGSLIQARVKKDDHTMALDPAVQARFDALKNKANGAAPPPAADPEPEAEPAPAAAAKPTIAKRPPGRPAGIKKAAPKATEISANGSIASMVAELGAALAEAEAGIATATAQRDEVLGMLRAALAE